MTPESPIDPPAPLPFSAAADRNKEPIFAVLTRLLPSAARILEVASGTGQHAAFFASQRPDWTWQTSDAPAAALATLSARCAGLANCPSPCRLDVLAPDWPVARDAYDALYCANMIHIAPWAACVALMQGAARHLDSAGVLVLYGPFFDDRPASPGNVAFDADLRSRDPSWGIRQLADVVEQARRAGLELLRREAMPANNQLLVFGRSAPRAGI